MTQTKYTPKYPAYLVEDRGYLTPCHVWQRGLNSMGYGKMRVGKRIRGAHVVAWEAANGPVPNGKVLDHLCRVPRCINPDHLEPVTPLENSRRRIDFKLSLEKAAAIRERYPSSGESMREIALDFDVTESAIRQVISGRTWIPE